MFPHHNPLPVPQALKAPRYDEVWQGLRSFVLDYIADKSPDDLGAIRQTLDNNSELLTKVMQALAAFLVGFARESNYNALQMFGMYSQQSDLIDVIVSQLNVKR